MPGLLKEKGFTQQRCDRGDMEVPRMMENRDSREGEQKGGEELKKKRKKQRIQNNLKEGT